MALTPEAKVKQGVRKVLKELGAYHVMPVTGGYGAQGAPDFLVCYKGRFIGIETKAGTNMPTKLQDMNLQHIKNCGGIALVVREQDVPTLAECIKTLTKENGNASSNEETIPT